MNVRSARGMANMLGNLMSDREDRTASSLMSLGGLGILVAVLVIGILVRFLDRDLDLPVPSPFPLWRSTSSLWPIPRL